MKVSIVIVHWNTPDSLRKLLALLRKSDALQIIVVDNHSKKNVSWVKDKNMSVALIQNKINKGYAAACNQGAEISRGEWIVFLNPDVSISAKQILNLIEEAENKNYDAFSIAITEKYKKPIPSGLSLLSEFTPLKHIIPLSIFPKKTLTGGLLFIKKKVLKDIGGWDEKFYLWFEDSDLSRRLVNEGYKVGWLKGRIQHKGGESFSLLDEKKRRELFFKSMDTYAKKHLTLFGQSVVRILNYRYAYE